MAALMRGGNVNEISLVDDAYCDLTHRPDHCAFLLYAGPWAEARVEWSEETTDEGIRDCQGRSFAERVTQALVNNPDDWSKYERAMGGNEYAWVFGGCELAPPPPDEAWHLELEDAWSDIQHLAVRVLAGEETIDVGHGKPSLVLMESHLWRNADWIDTGPRGVRAASTRVSRWGVQR